MRRVGLGSWFVLALVLMLVQAAFAQEAPPAPPVVDFADLLRKVVALPAFVAAVLAFVKHGIAFIPNKYIPYIAPVLAMFADVLAQAVAGVNLTPAASGASSVITAGLMGLAVTGGHQSIGGGAVRTSNQIADLEAQLAEAKRRAGIG